MCTNIISDNFHEYQNLRLTEGLLKGEGVITYLFVGVQGVSEVGNIFCRGIGIYFVVYRLASKIAVYRIMHLVIDMATDVKRSIDTSILGL